MLAEQSSFIPERCDALQPDASGRGSAFVTSSGSPSGLGLLPRSGSAAVLLSCFGERLALVARLVSDPAGVGRAACGLV